MKNENVFETDSPTIEMETRNLRQTQQGQPIPYVSGVSFNPYTGVPNNPSQAYSLHQGFSGFNNPAQQQINPQYINPSLIQQQQPYPFGAGLIQPVITGIAPNYFGNPFPTPYNAFPTPYINNQFQGNFQHPAAQYAQAQWFGAPYAQPFQNQLTGFPTQQPNFNAGQLQPSPYFQPAFNVTDGQMTLLPNQNPQGTLKNGTQYSKNGERDFIGWFPNVNILETDRSFKIEICVPGVAKENCRINVDKNNILRVSGTRRWNQETDAVGFTRKEFNYGSFACSFLLTENLQKEKITSSCRNGLLIVSIPKRDVNETGEDRSFSDISVN